MAWVNLAGIMLIAGIVWWFWLSPSVDSKKADD
jgi:plastocyanin domain-containing protein